MTAFPSSLPAPHVDTYEIAPDAAFVRTDMEGGYARQRRRFTAVPTRLSLAWVFTASEMAAFVTFYESSIDHGASWFTLALDIGSGSATQDVRFFEPYKAQRMAGGAWRVSAQVEVA